MAIFKSQFTNFWASQAALVVRNFPANAGKMRAPGSIPGSRRSRERHDNPLQCQLPNISWSQ